MKLYGEELDKELARRKECKEARRSKGITLRTAAATIGAKMGLTPSEYIAWESGDDICQHEECKKQITGVHPPFLVIDRCTKCGHTNIIGKSDEVDENILEEALLNAGMIQEKRELK
jgi:hypothetical protein